jgi:hypothetical protein
VGSGDPECTIVDVKGAAALFTIECARKTPPLPAPFISRNATEVRERGRGCDPELRHVPDAVDHDEDRVGDVILRDGEAASAAGGNDPCRTAAERMKHHRGGIAVLFSKAEPCGDAHGRSAGAPATCATIRSVASHVR